MLSRKRTDQRNHLKPNTSMFMMTVYRYRPTVAGIKLNKLLSVF